MANAATHHINKWFYLLGYTAPSSALAGLLLRGWYSPGAMYIGFWVMPWLKANKSLLYRLRIRCSFF